MAVEFYWDIDPSESQNLIQQVFEKMFEDRFISDFFRLFFSREIKKK